MDGLTVMCQDEHTGAGYHVYRGDCCDVLRYMPDRSIGMAVYSPPFGDLFVYSDSIADMGNSSTDGEFAEHYKHLTHELARVMMPGRIVAVHCSDLPTRKWKDGFVGLRDFSGDLVRCHQAAGMRYHGRVTVWRDPVTEMQRTKSVGLLYKQLKKDSTRSRPGLPDYVLFFSMPGDNPEPVMHGEQEFPVTQWQEWASPVWMDIAQTDVLNVACTRSAEDERHLCPLQLPLIERVVTLFSNPGDTVLSPFMGIGSEGVVSLKLGRKFVGVELKEAYFRQAVKHLRGVENEPTLL